MSLTQRDYILRLLEAVAAAIARALRRRKDGDLAGARDEVRDAVTALLGPLAPVSAYTDARTMGNLIGEPRRIAAWAQLLAEDATTLREMGDVTGATQLEQRAVELLVEARRRGPLEKDAATLLDALHGPGA